MKRGKKLLVVGLIGLMMAAGLVLVGCKPACSESGDCVRVAVNASTSYGTVGNKFCDSSDCASYKASGQAVTADVKCDC
ncbi:hypothetical protein FACS189476_10910 [Spirochaetia bacterium]|nr:hypothetical protein FACS189476_10910 [Spirochaetia bacterium]